MKRDSMVYLSLILLFESYTDRETNIFELYMRVINICVCNYAKVSRGETICFQPVSLDTNAIP